ncbi:MAG: hypothetical protein ACI4LX_10320 [Treponema sp.]
MKKYNTSLFSFLISFVLFGFIFVSLVNSGYFFEKPVILFAFAITVIWAIVFFIKEKLSGINNKETPKKNKIISYTVLFCIGLFLGFYYSVKIWYSGYLNLFPIENFLNGTLHLDTSYLTTVAESFKTNGYPSIMLNDNKILHYHVISNFILSLFSCFLNIPAIISYCYLYPIVFIPLYVFLFQEVVIELKKKFYTNYNFGKKDITFFICFLLGFNFFNIADKISYFFNSIIVSESCLTSFILILLCLKISLPRTERKYIQFLVIPIFIFLISGAKISSGLIFLLAISYFLFRKKPKSIKNWILIILYGLFFILAYLIFAHGSSHAKNDTSFKILAFARDYVQTPYRLFHYLFYFIPVLLLFKFKTQGKLFSKEYFASKENIWFELAFLITVFSWIPGIFFEIAGGSAEYFTMPAFFIVCLILWGMGTLDDIFNFYKKNFVCNYKNILLENFVVYCLVMFALIVPTAKKLNLKHCIMQTLKTGNAVEYENVRENLNKKEKLELLFSKAESLKDERYVNLVEIRNKTSKEKKNYCIYLTKDCWISKSYPSHEHVRADWNLRGAYATASFYGLPIINAFYEKDGVLYRWTDEKIANTNDKMFYGLESVVLKEKITTENMSKYAKALNRSKIIVLE